MRPGETALNVQAGVEQPPTLNPNRRIVRPRRASIDEHVHGLLAGDPLALSRAITLVESQRPQDREVADALVEKCLPWSGQSVRVGITGVPGVGKSTLLESLGSWLAEAEGKKLAVLAVDPSSEVSGGSILGDKSRMATLSGHPRAFVRPSPSRGSLGGVTRQTRESIVLCEAAGYEVVFVETVGVGQSEVAVKQMTDCFLLLMLAGAGDELQGMKRGIMEMADLLAITKVDGENVHPARIAQRNYQNALHLFPRSPSGWSVPVLTCSASTGEGIPEVWRALERYLETERESGQFEVKRQKQRVRWLRDEVHEALTRGFYEDPAVQAKMAEFEEAVRSGSLSPARAAAQLMEMRA